MSARGRLVYGVASQGVSSLTNFAIVIIIGRTQSPTALGAWTLAFAVVVLGGTLGRAAISTPVILSRAETPRRDVGGGLGVAAACGLATGLLTLVLGLVGVVPLLVAVALALTAVPVVAQDFLRYAWIARGRPRNALLLDLTWLVVQFAGTAAYLATGGDSILVLTFMWGGAALVSVVVGRVADGHARLSGSSTRDFVRTHRADSQRLFGEALANAIGSNLLPFVVAAVVGYAGAGAFRLTLTLFAPLTTLVAGLGPVVLRELSVRVEAGRSTRRIRASWSGGLFVVNLGYCAVLLLLPDSIGRELAGESWGRVSLLLVPLTVVTLLRPAMTIGLLFLRANRRFALLRTSSWLFVAPGLVWTAAGGALWGVAGAGWGQAVDTALRTGFYTAASARVPRRP